MTTVVNQELLDLAHEVIARIPRDVPSDYCKGYHMAAMFFKRFAEGKDPFTLEIQGIKISLSRNNTDAE